MEQKGVQVSGFGSTMAARFHGKTVFMRDMDTNETMIDIGMSSRKQKCRVVNNMLDEFGPIGFKVTTRNGKHFIRHNDHSVRFISRVKLDNNGITVD